MTEIIEPDWIQFLGEESLPFPALSSTVNDEPSLLPRLDELRMLQDGWLDGQGKALDRQELDWFSDNISRLYLEKLPLPYLYPTVDGNIRMEWTFDMREISVEVDLHARKGECNVLDVSTSEEQRRVLNLTDDTGWTFISERIKKYALGKEPST